MKANELMIGDYVGYLPTWENEDSTIQRDGNPNNPIICKVEMLGSSVAQLDNGEGCFDADDIELYPIPLTSEILEKNGFKEEQLPIGVRKVIWESEDTRTEIVLYMDDTMPMEIRKNIYYEDEISYTLPFVWAVHQFQQVLRLCNIEKTIEL